VVISTVFAFYVPINLEIRNLQSPFLPGGGRKGQLGASRLTGWLAPSPDYSKVLERWFLATAEARASLTKGQRQDSY